MKKKAFLAVSAAALLFTFLAGTVSFSHEAALVDPEPKVISE